MRHRRRWFLAVAAVVLVGLGVAAGIVLPGKRGSPEGGRPPNSLPAYEANAAQARTLARTACHDLNSVVAAVDQNETAAQVLHLLADFEQHAVLAYTHDVTWLPLASAAKELDAAVTDNDAQLTQQALETARRECKGV